MDQITIMILISIREDARLYGHFLSPNIGKTFILIFQSHILLWVQMILKNT